MGANDVHYQVWAIHLDSLGFIRILGIWITHVLEDEVDVLVVVGAVHIQQPDDVGMVAEVLQEHDLPEGPLRIRLIPESVEYLLDGHHTSGFLVHRLPYYSVSLT